MGVQLGYVSQMVTLLPGLAEQTSPLMLLLSTTPYRLFPLLYIAFTICNRPPTLKPSANTPRRLHSVTLQLQ